MQANDLLECRNTNRSMEEKINLSLFEEFF